MILGVISAIIGAIIFIVTLTNDISTVQQQTVQYLGFVCASIFIVGGFIMITIKKDMPEKPNANSILPQNDKEVLWDCPKCGNKNPNNTFKCEKCGYSLN
jgi:predicted RNA-binding Zn-ribbon protein involved in translation (DUF1610 family)